MLSYIRKIYEYYNSSSKKEKHQITINNNSYDISEYNHPGGSIILDAINNDATNIFYSTHPKYVWDLIEKPSFKKKYQISSQEGSSQQIFNDDFYLECKQYLQNYKIQWEQKYGIYLDTLIVSLWTSSWLILTVISYLTMLHYHGNFLPSIMLGIIWSMGIFNTMHPSMHGGLFNRCTPIKLVLDNTYTIFSGSAVPRWIDNHNFQHHGNTNTEYDPDKHTTPFLRLHPLQPKKWWYRYQSIYFPILACINTLTNQLKHLKYVLNKKGNKKGNMRPTRLYNYYFSLCLWIILAYLIPIYKLGFPQCIPPCFIFQMTGSFWATYNIVINHIFEGVYTYTNNIGKSFAQRQVLSSCNHSTGSMIATYLTGGLNHQIEHHLFPSLPIHHYPLISKDIERICKKHKIKYNSKNIVSLLISVHATLKLYGTCETNSGLPDLGDYNHLMDT